ISLKMDRAVTNPEAHMCSTTNRPGARRRRFILATLAIAATLIATTPAVAQDGARLEERGAATVADLLGVVSSILGSLGALPEEPGGEAGGEANEGDDGGGGSLPSMGFEIEPNG
ncbi:MAG: hypothetical protein AAGF23_07465, partial [Acidobacteriota bacterium]